MARPQKRAVRRRRASEEEIEYYTGREQSSGPGEEELGGGAAEDVGTRHLEGANGTCEVWRAKFYSLTQWKEMGDRYD